MRSISTYGRALAICTVVLMIFSSCGSRKNMVYLQPDSTIVNTVYENYIPKIQVNDIMTISVTAADPKVTAPFNFLSTLGTGNMTQATEMSMRPTYTVDHEGNILFPMIGKVHIAGLTRLEAIAKLRIALSDYIKEPGVNMNFNNFRVSVLGEVARPGSFTLPTERLTVLEALAMAGDLTIRGVRKNVKVIREVEGGKTIHLLDLTKQETLNSPYYYLAQNDVIYVEPNKTVINNSKLGANSSIFISVAGLAITVISLLTR